MVMEEVSEAIVDTFHRTTCYEGPRVASQRQLRWIGTRDMERRAPMTSTLIERRATAARRGGDELRSRHVRTAPTPGAPAPGRGGQAPGGHPRCGDRRVRRQRVRRGEDPV